MVLFVFFFEDATVKSDCPMEENCEIFKVKYRLLVALLVLLFVLEILKKKN